MANLSWLKTFGGGFLKLFGSFFKIRFFFFFTLFIILNSLIIGFQTKDPVFIIKDLGERSLTPTIKLHQTSLKIINEGGLFSETRNVFKEFFNIWGILSEFWFIYLEVIVLAWIFRKAVLFDDSKGGVSILLGLATFIILQMLFLAFIGGDMLLPINVYKDVASAGGIVINDFVNMGDFLRKSNDSFKNLTDLNLTGNETNLTEVINNKIKGVITYSA